MNDLLSKEVVLRRLGMAMECEICVCKDCILSEVPDKGYKRCWNCMDCEYGEKRTEYCSMRNNYEDACKKRRTENG